VVDLLTRSEYGAIAATLSLPSAAFVDGGFRQAVSGAVMPTIDPATGSTLTEIAACGPEDVDFAVAKARQAFEDGRWRAASPGHRKEVLIRLTKLMLRNRRELAVLESIDSATSNKRHTTVFFRRIKGRLG
jgi:gamma-glutamyl-gamma-aminobutyraldehyde dehydrogenase